MLKKTLAAAAIAGAIVLGSASAAFADYPATSPITVSAPSIAVGGSTTITVSDLGDYEEVTFSVAGAGATLSSIVLASTAGSSVVKPVVDGSASATFTSATAGDYSVVVSADGNVLGTVGVTVGAVGGASGSGDSAAGGTGTLPATGGDVPAAAIWVGVGAIGLGGIAIAAVAARRRTQKV